MSEYQQLYEQFASHDKSVREQAIQVEQERQKSDVDGLSIDTLSVWSEDSDWRVRQSCAATLKAYRSTQAHLLLFQLAEDKSKRVANKAREVLMDLATMRQSIDPELLLETLQTCRYGEQEPFYSALLNERGKYGLSSVLHILERSKHVPLNRKHPPFLQILYKALSRKDLGVFFEYFQWVRQKPEYSARLDQYPSPFDTQEPPAQRVRLIVWLWALKRLKGVDALELLNDVTRTKKLSEEAFPAIMMVIKGESLTRSRSVEYVPIEHPEMQSVLFEYTSSEDSTMQEIVAYLLGRADVPVMDGLVALLGLMDTDKSVRARQTALKAWEKKAKEYACSLEEHELILLLRMILANRLDRLLWNALCIFLDHLWPGTECNLELIISYVDMHVLDENRVRFANHKPWTKSLLKSEPSPFFRIARQLHMGLLSSHYSSGLPKKLLEHILHSPHVEHIHELYAAGLRYDDRLIEVIANSSSLGNLKNLHLQANHISSTGVERLATCENLPSLTHLYVGNNNLQDQDVFQLMEAPFFPQLETLSLKRNPVTSATLKALLHAPQSRELKRLILTDTQINSTDVLTCLQSCDEPPAWKDNIIL